MDKLIRFLQAHTLSKETHKILVGISGGPDSVLLAWALHELGYPIGLAHVNYQMRGKDSAYEQELVVSYAQKWGVPVYVKEVEGKVLAEGHSASFQQLARDVRYRFFEEICQQEEYDFLATAHHKDDQLETLLMSLIKGSPHQVFKGIPPQLGRIIRPMLDIEKSEILAVLKEENLSYGIDVSNHSTVYLRNQVRNQLIPMILDINPSFPDKALQTYKIYQLEQQFIESSLSEWTKGQIPPYSLDWRKFLASKGKAFLPILVSKVLAVWGLHGYERQAGIELIDSQVGKRIHTSIGEIYRTHHGLACDMLSQENREIYLSLEEKEVEGLHPTAAGDVRLSLVPYEDVKLEEVDSQYADWSKISFPIMIRTWKAGDRMKPLGMSGSKKISDILNDLKVSPAKKSGMLVLADSKGIFSLKGYRISDKVKLAKDSTRVLKIVYEGI